MVSTRSCQPRVSLDAGPQASTTAQWQLHSGACWVADARLAVSKPKLIMVLLLRPEWPSCLGSVPLLPCHFLLQHRNSDHANVEAACRRSLAALRLDYLDL